MSVCRDAPPVVATIEEAIGIAAAEGIKAAAAKDEPAYKNAVRKLTEWCRANGVQREAHDAALATLKSRVAAGVKPTAPADPPLTDEERLRRIDEGKA